MSEQIQISGAFINFTRKESLICSSVDLKSIHSLPLFDEASSFKVNTLDDDLHYVCIICIRNPFTSFDFIKVFFVWCKF